ncbi:MAG: carbon-nitrogen hydrolase family protein [Acidobacteriota bacterium]|nr:carbon-nitrogen hydrolase family protein [Acidobacteriota bacterium]
MSRSGRRWTVAAVQMTSTENRKKNLAAAERLARQARNRGADLIAFPENFAYLRSEGSKIRFSESLDGDLAAWLGRLSRELDVYLLAGSIPEKIRRSPRIHNTSLLFGPRGDLLARYRKIHLFDINIRGGAVFMESKTVAPGDEPVVVDTPLGRLGLSVCYDLRFPELYRRLAMMGAQVVFVPAAFTAYTGKFHWMTLLRARAIENQCWVVAPAQVGKHTARRRSHGETAIIDPWGTVVGVRDKGPGVVTARIDLDKVDRVRRGLPCLDHVRRELFRPLPRRRRA